VLDAPSQVEVFSYYYQGDLPLIPLPQRRPPDIQQTRMALTNLAQRQRRVFAILWATNESDPDGIVENWLNQHGYKALDVWYGNVRLAMWSLSPVGSGQVEHRLDVDLGEQVTLIGYSLGATQVAAGDVLPLTLYWQAQHLLAEPYKVFIHLLDRHGQIVAQRDSEPGGGSQPTTSWRPGELITDNYGVLIPFGTPPGPVQVVVGLYNARTGQRLIPPNGPSDGRVPVATVELARPAVPPPVAALGFQHASSARFGPLRLLGYSRLKLDAEHDPAAALHRGDTINLVLFWQMAGTPPVDPSVQIRVSLVDRSGQSVVEHSGPPLDGTYPLTDWLPGEVVRDSYLLSLPGEIQAGRYRLRIDGRRATDGMGLGDPVWTDDFVVE
jgi:hypothetical protein